MAMPIAMKYSPWKKNASVHTKDHCQAYNAVAQIAPTRQTELQICTVRIRAVAFHRCRTMNKMDIATIAAATCVWVRHSRASLVQYREPEDIEPSNGSNRYRETSVRPAGVCFYKDLYAALIGVGLLHGRKHVGGKPKWNLHSSRQVL